MQLKLLFASTCIVAYSSLMAHAVLYNVAAWAAYQAITATQAAIITGSVVSIPTGTFFYLSFLNAFNKKRKEAKQPEVPRPPYGFNNADGNIIINTQCDLLQTGALFFNTKEGETQDCRVFSFIDSRTNRACSWTNTGEEDQEYILPIPYSKNLLTLFKTEFYSKEPVTSVVNGGFRYSNLDSKCVRPYRVPKNKSNRLTKTPVLHVMNDCKVYKELYTTHILPKCRQYFPPPPN
ncbi:hypothetical protein FBU30_009522 [Linnemannia zychae]|nr:hypothetical protein FBU30_009522 [Linnemannia zychae]